jgi:hypothetical protein
MGASMESRSCRSCPHGNRPSAQGRPPSERGHARDVEIFTRKPAREGRPTDGLSYPQGTHHGARRKHRKMTVALNRNFAGSVPNRNR